VTIIGTTMTALVIATTIAVIVSAEEVEVCGPLRR